MSSPLEELSHVLPVPRLHSQFLVRLRVLHVLLAVPLALTPQPALHVTQDLVLAQVPVLSVLLTDSLLEVRMPVLTALLAVSLLLEPPPVLPVLLAAPPAMMHQHALRVTQDLASTPALAFNVLPTLSQLAESMYVLIVPLINSQSLEPPLALPALVGVRAAPTLPPVRPATPDLA